MAGTLTISTLSDGTNSTSTTNLTKAPCVAWVNFNGTTATPSTIRASYNVTSVTKNGTGDYTINFTNALTDANYSVSGLAGNANAFGNFGVSTRGAGAGYTSSLCRINTYATNTGTVTDADSVCFAATR
jgi:hypothetical protein